MAHDPVWGGKGVHLPETPPVTPGFDPPPSMGTAAESLTTRARPAGLHRAPAEAQPIETEARALLSMFEEGLDRRSDTWALALLARALLDLVERVERLESAH